MNKVDLTSQEWNARLERKLRAAEDGAQAMKDAAEKAVAVRKNMIRLRELRVAKEAAEVRARIASANVTPGSKPRS